MPVADHEWRPTDLEALRVALGIPVTPAGLRAINDEMVRLQTLYPDAIPLAKDHLDAIALIDNTAAPPADPAPVVRKVTRKGAVDPLPARCRRRSST